MVGDGRVQICVGCGQVLSGTVGHSRATLIRSPPHILPRLNSTEPVFVRRRTRSNKVEQGRTRSNKVELCRTRSNMIKCHKFCFKCCNAFLAYDNHKCEKILSYFSCFIATALVLSVMLISIAPPPKAVDRQIPADAGICRYLQVCCKSSGFQSILVDFRLFW